MANRFNRNALLLCLMAMALLSAPAGAQTDPWVTMTTECGTGRFSFEPYPAVIQAGVATPIIEPRVDGNCIFPGDTITIQDFFSVYPDASYISDIDLAFYHRKLVYGGAGYQWNVFADPDFMPLYSFAVTTSTPKKVNISIPASITGKVPTAVRLRITYVRHGGGTRTVLVNKKAAASDHDLFFIPTYGTYMASKRMNIGWDLFPRTIYGETMYYFNVVYPRGWERYCRTSYISVSKSSSFPGTVKFRSPCAYQSSPSQGYQVSMNGASSGSFSVIYQVICPLGVLPSGSNYLGGWTLAGTYTNLNVLRANKGMPANSNIKRQSSVAGSCPAN